MSGVTVAIPVRDGGAALERTLEALSGQSLDHELLVCDSGSRDGSPALARRHGARVLEIPSEQFSHGGTRNLLMSQARGDHVALLSQDAEPASARWLERLLAGFQLAPDVGLVFGPYLARPDTSLAVRLELAQWFGSLAPDRAPRVDRLDLTELPAGSDADAHTEADAGGTGGRGAGGGIPAAALMGARGFFSDVNACVSRAAWARVPYREVPYAEDRVLAIDMLRAGFAKAFVPDAGVYHAHEYTSVEQLRRCFDEWRGLREVYGWREPADPVHLSRQLRGALGSARRDPALDGASAAARAATLAAVSRHHVLRLAGAVLGSRADALPAQARRALSLERRADFVPLRLDQTQNTTHSKDHEQ